mmetsp:Transcript_28132/g.62770  ORF Transcript_28132/g.62770 Transcript_28132/m.62770 type:complete len:237 (-) Transcript_28132:346-1056(-)
MARRPPVPVRDPAADDRHDAHRPRHCPGAQARLRPGDVGGRHLRRVPPLLAGGPLGAPRKAEGIGAQRALPNAPARGQCRGLHLVPGQRGVRVLQGGQAPRDGRVSGLRQRELRREPALGVRRGAQGRRGGAGRALLHGRPHGEVRPRLLPQAGRHARPQGRDARARGQGHGGPHDPADRPRSGDGPQTGVPQHPAPPAHPRHGRRRGGLDDRGRAGGGRRGPRRHRLHVREHLPA